MLIESFYVISNTTNYFAHYLYLCIPLDRILKIHLVIEILINHAYYTVQADVCRPTDNATNSLFYITIRYD